MFRKIVVELWYNRPWRYIPAVVKFMKDYPLGKDGKFFIWLRNCFYLNWQVAMTSEEYRKSKENKNGSEIKC